MQTLSEMSFLSCCVYHRTLMRVRVESWKALSLRSCFAQFDPWSRDHVGCAPLSPHSTMPLLPRFGIFSGRAGSGKNWTDLDPIRANNAVRTLYLRLTLTWYDLVTIIGKWIYVGRWSYASEWYHYTVSAMLPMLSDLCTLHLRSKRPIRYNHAVPPFW